MHWEAAPPDVIADLIRNPWIPGQARDDNLTLQLQ
jgi:hypothetical protein